MGNKNVTNLKTCVIFKILVSVDVTYCDQVDQFQAESKLLEDQCDTCIYLMRNIEGETSRHVKLLEKEEERNKEILKALLVTDNIIYEDDVRMHFS